MHSCHHHLPPTDVTTTAGPLLLLRPLPCCDSNCTTAYHYHPSPLSLARVGGVSCVACSAIDNLMHRKSITLRPGDYVFLPSRVPWQLVVGKNVKVFRPQNCLANSKQTHSAVTFSNITLIIVFLSYQAMRAISAGHYPQLVDACVVQFVFSSGVDLGELLPRRRRVGSPSFPGRLPEQKRSGTTQEASGNE